MRVEQSLDGYWKFCPAFQELEANQRFMAPVCDPAVPEAQADPTGPWIQPGYDDRGWMDIPVPASWNKAIPDLWSYEGHGWYRRQIAVPVAWEGRRVVFESDGANYLTVLYVNGRKVGEHEGGYTPFALPVHGYLEYGATNTIAISVDNIPKPERCPGGQYDWWNHGGLYRSCRLRAMDMTHIEDVEVVTRPGDPTSTVDLKIEVRADAGPEDGLQIAAELTDAGGVAVASGTAPLDCTGDTASAALCLRVEDASLWSPDTPNLYGLQVWLRETATGKRRDSWQRRIGIRSVEVVGPRLLVNGEPFLVKGFSRYEDYPDSGRTRNDVACRRDLELIKEMGGNTIRCHCPNSPETYEICDEMGVFFVSELPLYQWGRPLVRTDSPEALVTGKQQLREMIGWQRHHPCILMWSVSNENMCKPRQDTERYRELTEMTVQGNLELVDLTHQLDPTRPVIEVSNCWPGDPVFARTDISAANMYIGASTPRVDTVHELAQTMATRLDALREEHPDKPILISEFGSWCVRGLKTDYFPGEAYQAELLKAYWEGLVEQDQVIGGLIWCFADTDVHRRFEWVYEYRCAYGVYDNDRNPKQAVEVLKQLWRESG